MATVAIDIRLIGKQRTGDEQVFFGLTKALLHNHPEHQYVLVTDKKEDELVMLRERLELEKTQATVELVSFGPRNRFWWNALTLPGFFLKRKDIDVFHTQYILPFFIPKRIKVVAHIHDVSFARYPQYIGKSDLFFLDLFIPHTCRRATIIAVPSLFTKQEVQEVYKVTSEKVVVIPNALGEAFVQPVEPASIQRATELRAKYNLPDKYLLYVGTLQPRKNIPYLLEMFSQYHEKYPETQEVKLVLVGNREAHHFDNRIDEVIKNLQLEKEVIFPGYIDSEDLAFLYHEAQAFVFPSLYEGFGIPLLESVSTGTPTLASDIPVHREVGGESVQYFPLSSIAEAAQILYTISITGRKKSFPPEQSWATSAQILARVYGEISGK